ncbi:Uu.00g028060.m01.CDS01 [Anthostomella pinea]|uniref:Uu.00g028060.m01.CDS01 n=1 Tax=Anthostomella pinea TaxID=933095 RepID=A0AAI8YCW5_9PEZI|nr:Uu.00g028060.m01.CDS01 [Anthostomella pinea]
MTRGWSEGASTVTVVGSTTTASSRASNPARRHEVDGMYKLLQREPHDGVKCVIAVVGASSFTSLDHKLQNPWWKFWKPNPGVFVTTPRWLQRTINQVEDEGRCQHLTIFISKKVDSISFHMNSSIHDLGIYRCSHYSHHSYPSSSSHPHPTQSSRGSRVLVDGASTFNGVRLDEWQGTRHRRHAIFLGDGVGISVELEGADGFAPWTEHVAWLPSEQREQIYGHFICMKQSSPNHNNGTDEPCWSRWRKHLAIVVGVLSGAGEIAPAFEVTPTGCFVEYKFGAVATPFARMRTVASAAGQARLLGARVLGTPVYFVSWRGLLKWIHGALAVLCKRYWAALERLWQFVARMLLRGADEVRGHHVRPTLQRSKSSRDGKQDHVRPPLQRSNSSRDGKHVSWKGRGITVSHCHIGDS